MAAVVTYCFFLEHGDVKRATFHGFLAVSRNKPSPFRLASPFSAYPLRQSTWKVLLVGDPWNTVRRHQRRDVQHSENYPVVLFMRI